VSGAVVHSAGNVIFTDNNTSGGTFMYTGATDPSSSDTGDVTINRAQAGQSQLDGTGLGDILVGRDNAPDTLLGNAGDDVLIGGNNTNNSIVSFTLTADGSNLSSNNGFLQFHFTDGTAGVDFVQNVSINLRGGSDGNAIFDGEAGLSRNGDGEWGPTATSLTGLASGNISLPSADNTGTMSVNFTNGSFGVGDGFNLAIDVDNLGSNSDGGQFAAQGVTATITLQNGRTQTTTFTAVDGDTSVATFKVATDDVLNGGAGNDLLIGGSGGDVFQFSANFGHDTALDFHPGEDLIEIDHTVFADFSALMAHTAAVGTDTVITADANNSITLHDVGVATLHPSSFLFT
jgi:Ca2+-binding RTX toxin-like protein